MPTDLVSTLRKILGPEAYIVGGSLRDFLLRRASPDIDIAVKSETPVKLLAHRLAKELGGKSFPLDEETHVSRIIISDEVPLQIDLSAFQGKDLAEDLARRDFTVNAMAYPLGNSKLEIRNSKLKGISNLDTKPGIRITGLKDSEIIDLHGGRKDIKSGIIRATNDGVFKEDPVRALKAFRCAAELGWKIHLSTLKLIKEHSSGITRTSPERIHDELLRLLENKGSAGWLRKMDETGILTAIFPDLDSQRNCAEVYYGKGGVLKHSLLVVDRIEYLLDSIENIFPHLKKKLASFRSQKAILKLAALLHDLAKPSTAKKVADRLRFFGHEEKGAQMAERVLEKLRFSRAHVRLISKMTLHHLRPGNLAANQYISNKAMYRFFRELGADGVPLLLLCWADHTSYLSMAQLRSIEKRIAEPPIPIPEGGLPATGPVKTLRYVQVINRMLTLYLTETSKLVPVQVINGNDVMKILKLPPGPKIGEILERVRVAQAEEKVASREEALQFIKRFKPRD